MRELNTSIARSKSNHIIMVAEIMYTLALDYTKDIDKAEEMYTLGYVHDIGYNIQGDGKQHAQIGGELLRKTGYKYWQEVSNHGLSDTDYRSKELYLLDIVDMSVTMQGKVVSFEDRLLEIQSRHPGMNVAKTFMRMVDKVEYLTGKQFDMSKIISIASDGSIIKK